MSVRRGTAPSRTRARTRNSASTRISEQKNGGRIICRREAMPFRRLLTVMGTFAALDVVRSRLRMSEIRMLIVVVSDIFDLVVVLFGVLCRFGLVRVGLRLRVRPLTLGSLASAFMLLPASS